MNSRHVSRFAAFVFHIFPPLFFSSSIVASQLPLLHFPFSRLRGNDKTGLFIRVIRPALCAIRDIRDPRVSFSFVSFLVAAMPRCTTHVRNRESFSRSSGTFLYNSLYRNGFPPSRE
jgi:hypothetical protein